MAAAVREAQEGLGAVSSRGGSEGASSVNGVLVTSLGQVKCHWFFTSPRSCYLFPRGPSVLSGLPGPCDRV